MGAQIEYYNEFSKKGEIKQIMKYITQSEIDEGDALTYVVFHHSVSFKIKEADSTWRVHTDHEKTVLYKGIAGAKFDANAMQLKFNQVNQGYATKHMLHFLN